MQSGELRKQGVRIRFPHQSSQILQRLLERPGEVVTREELRQKLWPADTFVDFDMGLSSAVKKVRDALGDSAENSRFVETLPRRGYRFIGTVQGTTAAPEAASSAAGSSSGVEAARIALPQEAALAAAGVWLRRVGVGVLAAVLVTFVVGLTRGVPQRFRFGAGPRPIKSLAVLPLENLTGDPAQDYFVDGMHDALVTDLAQISSLRVISRTSVMQYKEAKKPLRAIARELNVEGVVEGAVVRSGQRVRITAQLIDARTDRHLWARSFERDLSDIVALQGEVAQAIAEAVKAELAPQERARLRSPRQVNPEAYEAFLKGVLAAGSQSYEGFREAIAYFEEAITKQPDFALASAEMSLCYFQFAFTGPLSPQEFMPKAEAAARKALELNETLPEAHAALGLILYRFHWDWSRAEKEFRRALELNPNYAEGHRSYSEFLSVSGRSEEASAEAQRARELDPLSIQGI